MQSEFTMDMVKSNICLIGINAFMCLINDQQIPIHICNFPQLVIFAAKINRPFQILQTDKFNAMIRMN